MEKTTYYQLNKPEAADPLRLADFNENSDIIDGLLKNLSAERVKIGSYTGTDSSGRTLNLGFTPRFIMLMSEWDSDGGITLASPDFGFYIGSKVSSSSSRVVTGGVYISGNVNNNSSGGNYYIALL